MGIATSRELKDLSARLDKLDGRVSIIDNSTKRIEENVSNIVDRQHNIDEHLDLLSEKILNIQLLQEGRSVHYKHQKHTRSFMK